jgi:hypothetical protein
MTKGAFPDGVFNIKLPVCMAHMAGSTRMGKRTPPAAYLASKEGFPLDYFFRPYFYAIFRTI